MYNGVYTILYSNVQRTCCLHNIIIFVSFDEPQHLVDCFVLIHKRNKKLDFKCFKFVMLILFYYYYYFFFHIEH